MDTKPPVPRAILVAIQMPGVDDVAHALEGAHEILVIGPAQTKQEFAQYLRDKHPQLGRAIVAVENSDHPTDPEVLAFARRQFKALDRMFAPGPGG